MLASARSPCSSSARLSLGAPNFQFLLIHLLLLCAVLVAMLGRAEAADKVKPSVPGNLTATVNASSQVQLAWSASKDNVAVLNYRVYRDGGTVPIAQPATTTYIDKNVVAGATYSYAVRAVDTSGNLSALSNSAVVNVPSAGTAGMRGLWLWNSVEILGDPAQQDQLVSLAHASGFTDIFLFLMAADYVTYETQIGAFNLLMNQQNLRVWGLEGWRGYFSDASGPANYYLAIDNLIAFNSRVAPERRFVGFHSDMEPQDGQGDFPPTFHNDLTDSQLSTTGGGVWYATQAEDREMLMRDWLAIHQTARSKLAAAGLKMAAAMPFWTENYYGAPVMVTYNNVRASAGQQMMNFLDEYIVMSYNTDPLNAAGRVQAQAQYASTLPASARPRVSAAMETHAGAGINISYADTPGKNSRAVVLTDLGTISSTLSVYPAFGGVSIHDWTGWKLLPP